MMYIPPHAPHTDDESEIGDESEEDKWRWGKRGKKHPRTVAPQGWVSKRRKIDRLIKECESLIRATPVSLCANIQGIDLVF